MEDLRFAVGRCGQHLRTELGQDLLDVEDQARRLIAIVSQKGNVNRAVGGWLAGVPAPKATVERLLARLTEPTVAVAAWRDLVDACRKSGISADDLGGRRDLFRSLLSNAEISLRTTGRILAGVLHDSAAFVTEARVRVGDLDRDDVATWPGLDEAAGLEEAARLALCEQLIASRTQGGSHVVWFAFGQAHIGTSYFAVGPVTFYCAPMMQAMIGLTGPGKEWVPAELRRTDGWLRAKDIPTDDGLVFVRVDLGHGRFADPIRRATDLAHATVAVAKFDTGTRNWLPWSGYIHAVDGRVTSMPLFSAPKPEPEVVPHEDPTGDVLEELSATLGARLSAVPEELHEAINLVRWWQEAGEQSNLPRIVLDVRVVEWVASLVSSGKWYEFLTCTWKQQWIRNQIRGHLINTCIEAAGEPYAVAPEHRAQMRSLRDKIQVHHGRGAYTSHLDQALTALPALRSIHRVHTRTGRRLTTLADRLATPETLEKWCSQLEVDWTSQLDRLQRLRNALAHGGPASSDAVDTVGSFGRDLARVTLRVTLTGLLDGRGSVVAQEEIKTAADAWRAGIPLAPDAATALFH